ncbi:P63C domain-containing protein [Solimonas flava]|uniref:P63C domain-containing protein n=1 Tax=Solimonas flava TaxID=415849 RepID=UPI0004881DFA|nr:P63C domain-containing protein [Solimonas flava]
MKKKKEVKGRAKGGLAVAAKMTQEQKLERAKKGALARWGAKPVRALSKGNFKDDFGVDVDCYVVDDTQRTAVISQTGMATALGLSPRGNAFPRLINSQAMADSVSAELREMLDKTLIIQWGSGGAEAPPITVKGHDAALLIEVCNAIADADRKGKLSARYKKVVQQAAIINGASAKAGIKGLVYALAGYRPEVEEVIQAFKVFVQEEAKKYEQEFPNELYAAWQRLYKIPLPVRGKPWQFMHLTRKHIYFPLAKSNGKLLELLRALRAKDADQKRYLFQFLNDIGARGLRMQIGRVLEMAESSGDDAHAYEEKIIKRFGGQHELDFAVPIPPKA